MSSRLKNDFVVETKGFCFLCLNRIFSPQRSTASPVHSLGYLTNYLKLDMTKVFVQEGPIPPHLVTKVMESTLKVELCDTCVLINNTFSVLCTKLEKIEMEVNSYLKVVLSKLEKAVDADMTEEFVGFAAPEELLNLGKLAVVEALRKEASQNCSQKLLAVHPRVRIQKVLEVKAKKQRSGSETRDMNKEPPPPSELFSTGSNDEDDDDDPSQESFSDREASSPAANQVIDQEESPNFESIALLLVTKTGRRTQKTEKKKPSKRAYNSMLKEKRTSDPVTGKTECLVCSKLFSSIKTFDSHYNLAHLRIGYKCSICQRVFPSGSICRKHLKKAHKEVGENSLSMEKIFDRPVRPPKAEYLNRIPPPSRIGMEGKPASHIQFDSKTEKYKCQLCQKEFKSRRGAEDHVSTVHLHQRLKCGACGKEFPGRGHYLKHYSSCHMGVRFKCEVCGKSFSQKQSMTTHQRVAHLGHGFQCRICSETFSTLYHKYQHVKRNKCVGRKAKFSAPPEESSVSLRKVKAEKREPEKQLKMELRSKIRDRKEGSPSSLPLGGSNEEDTSRDSQSDGRRTEDIKEDSPPRPNLEPGDNDTFSDQIDSLDESDQSHSAPAAANEEKSLQSFHSIPLPPDADREIKRKTNEEKADGRSSMMMLRNKWTFNPETGRYACLACSKEFASIPTFGNHYRRDHRNIGYKCSICKKVFATSTTCRQHQKLFHKDKDVEGRPPMMMKKIFNRRITPPKPEYLNRIPPPELIGKVEKTFLHFTRDSNTDKYKCRHCQKEYNSRRGADGHVSAVHLHQRLKCGACGKEFPGRGHYTKHYLSCHMGVRFRCKVCGKSFAQKQAMTTHQRVTHLGHRFQCRICSETFSTLYAKSMHVKRKKCVGRKMKFEKESVSLDKVEAVEGLNKGEMGSQNCSQTLPKAHPTVRIRIIRMKKQSSKLRERKEGSPQPSSDVGDGSSNDADNSFQDAESVEDIETMDIKQDPPSPTAELDDNETCSDSDQSDLDGSDHDHSSSSPAPANEAKKLQKFTDSEPNVEIIVEDGYRRPMLVKEKCSLNPETGRYACSECSKDFSSIQTFAVHHRREHRNIGYKCSICKKVFSTSIVCRRHQKNLHQDVSSPAMEKILGRSTTTTSKPEYLNRIPPPLKMGMEGKPSLHFKFDSETDKYTCQLCQRGFNSRSAAHDHVSTLHLHQKWKCGACEKEFPLKGHYLKHYLSVHTGVRFKCKVCNKSFAQKQSLTNHQRVAHLLGHRFQCRICSEAFSTLDAKNEHVMRNKCVGGRESKFAPLDESDSLGKVEVVEDSENAGGPSMMLKDKRILSSETGRYECSECSKDFASLQTFGNHYRRDHGNIRYKCSVCKKVFSTTTICRRHQKNLHKDVGSPGMEKILDRRTAPKP